MSGPVAIDETWVRDHKGNRHRSLGAIVGEIREQLKSFFNTRVEMIRAELHETVAAARFGVPLILLALALVAVGFLLLSVAAAALVAEAFAGRPYAWFLGFAIVGVLWTVFGGVTGLFAFNALRRKFPKRTLEVLKADKLWLQSAVRSHT